MRDDDERRLRLGDEALEPLQAGEVEVVRRLVEQEDVEAGEQDRREAGPRLLATGERLERAVELDVEPEVGADPGGARLEVGTAQRDEAVGVVLGRSHARPAQEVAAQRLARQRVELLRQVADEPIPDDLARIRRLEPGEDAQERRLADPVRAGETDARAGRHDERDFVEDGARAKALRDMTDGQQGGTSAERRTGTCLRAVSPS